MKSLRKLLVLVLSLALCLSLAVPALAGDYTDVEPTERSSEAISYLSKIGIFNGYTDGSFRPQASVSKGEIAKLLCYVLEGKWNPIPRTKVAPDLSAYTKSSFQDVAADYWAMGYIEYCTEKGIITADGTFAPASPVTYEELIPMVLRALGLPADASARELGLLDNVAATDLSAPCTRADCAEILMNVLFYGETYKDTIGYRNFNLVIRPDIYDMPYLNDGNPRHTMDVFYPDTEMPEGGYPVIVFAHGGGFARNDKVSNDLEAFAQAVNYGYVMIAINYSDAVDAPLPYEILEGKAAVRYVRANAEALKINPDQIFISGQSAGAIVMGAVGASPNDPAFEALLAEMGAPAVSDAVCGTILFYGEYDYNTMWSHKAWQAGTLAEYDPELAAAYDVKYADYAKYNDFYADKAPGAPAPDANNVQLGGSMTEKADLIKMISPATYLNENTAPFFICHGTSDPVLSFLQSVDFAEALKAAGVPYELRLVEGKGHGDMFLTEVPMSELVAWMNDILGI